MAISMQQYLVMSKKRKRIGLFRPLLVCAALLSTLSACQTAPSSVSNRTDINTGMSSSTVTTTTQRPVTQAPVIQTPAANDPYNTSDRAGKPYVPSSQTTTPRPYPSYPSSQSTPNTNDSSNSTTTHSPTTHSPITQPTPVIEQPEDVFNEPVFESSRDDYIILQQPSSPSRNALLERARQNSQQQSSKATTDQSELPAFRNLMQTGTNQLKAGNLTAAEGSFTRAQRLAPRSSAVYFYLSQVALKKNQPRKAEAMARRGLSISQDASRRRALWQLILQSGQQQSNPRVIREAQQALR